MIAHYVVCFRQETGEVYRCRDLYRSLLSAHVTASTQATGAGHEGQSQSGVTGSCQTRSLVAPRDHAAMFRYQVRGSLREDDGRCWMDFYSDRGIKLGHRVSTTLQCSVLNSDHFTPSGFTIDRQTLNGCANIFKSNVKLKITEKFSSYLP
ncbi:hypothetical protein RRG08_015416 [Elysia crispata]|uniref:Uncharacterized protein n=1 Tax=Elysia crispata TaxID=231223 RepID=A0AAE0ZSD2_9GAST|nr:hypothetical protein RRG08_015416 [Elysia crispata]